MHEMSIVDAIMKTTDQIVKDENLTTVESVTVEIGEMSGVIPQFLTNCWDAMSPETIYENACLNIKTIPGKVCCEDCGTEFQANFDSPNCPKCGSLHITIMSGNDLSIIQVIGK